MIRCGWRADELETAGQHSTTPRGACFALESTVLVLSAATGHSKSLLGRALKPLSA